MEKFGNLRFIGTEIEAITAEVQDLQKASSSIESHSLQQRNQQMIERMQKRMHDLESERSELLAELEKVRQDNEDAYRIIFYRYVKGLPWMQVFNKVFPDMPSTDPVGYARHYIIRYWEKYQRRQ